MNTLAHAGTEAQPLCTKRALPPCGCDWPQPRRLPGQLGEFSWLLMSLKALAANIHCCGGLWTDLHFSTWLHTCRPYACLTRMTHAPTFSLGSNSMQDISLWNYIKELQKSMCPFDEPIWLFCWLVNICTFPPVHMFTTRALHGNDTSSSET